MKEVKRFHWYKDGMWEDGDPLPGDPRPTKGMWRRDADFDAVLKDRDALQGKLKVTVDALEGIARGNPENAFVRSAIEALAQIGLPEKEG